MATMTALFGQCLLQETLSFVGRPSIEIPERQIACGERIACIEGFLEAGCAKDGKAALSVLDPEIVRVCPLQKSVAIYRHFRILCGAVIIAERIAQSGALRFFRQGQFPDCEREVRPIRRRFLIMR